jgi:hypothetical protein
MFRRNAQDLSPLRLKDVCNFDRHGFTSSGPDSRTTSWGRHPIAPSGLPHGRILPSLELRRTGRSEPALSWKTPTKQRGQILRFPLR